ncbi:peptidase M23 [Bacillus pseudomycoides]|nr:peptidase M23 [Bacillus pseudomycoides]MEB3057378.1 peptidase M23 [Bacillus pseudomycoides]
MYFIRVEKLVKQWFIAYSKYPAGYGINKYDGPNGNCTGNVDGSVPYRVYTRQDGYLDIGNKTVHG